MACISYFGGKSSSVFQDFINSKIPRDGIKTYIEPFSGSMGTYMDDPTLNPEIVIYNDKNRHQVNLYKCCSEPNTFVEYLEKMKQTLLKTDETDPLKKWDFYKKIYKEYVDNDFLDNNDFEIGNFEKASIYAFLITSSFSSTYPRGGGFSGYKKDKDRLKLEVLIDKLKKGTYSKKLNSITHFFNRDFEDLILEFDAEDTYLYLDPPYARWVDGKSEDDTRRLFWYGAADDNVFGPHSHRRLLELLLKVKAKWSLSYYYFPLLEEILPKDKFHWFEKEVDRSSARGGNNSSSKGVASKGVEILITNYLS